MTVKLYKQNERENNYHHINNIYYKKLHHPPFKSLAIYNFSLIEESRR